MRRAGGSTDAPHSGTMERPERQRLIEFEAKVQHTHAVPHGVHKAAGVARRCATLPISWFYAPLLLLRAPHHSSPPPPLVAPSCTSASECWPQRRCSPRSPRSPSHARRGRASPFRLLHRPQPLVSSPLRCCSEMESPTHPAPPRCSAARLDQAASTARTEDAVSRMIGATLLAYLPPGRASTRLRCANQSPSACCVSQA